MAAWLPGSEGGGVADVLFRDGDGDVRFDFTGKLSFSWPGSAIQTPLNRGDADYDPLFPYGFGLTYEDEDTLSAHLSEVDDPPPLDESPREDEASESDETPGAGA